MRELLKHAVMKRVARNQMVMHRGDPGDGLYGVLSGSVVITVDSARGKELILNRHGPGEFFGEVALLDDAGRSASARAGENSRLLFLARGDFLAFLHGRPELMLRIVALLCTRLRRATGIIEDMAFLDVPTRLAKQIVRSVAAGASGAGPVRLSQAELARMLGVTREFVNKQLVAWREAGILELGHRRVVIRNRPALERLAGLQVRRSRSIYSLKV
jgi:CRP-like cAMP-binding protein